MDEQQVHEPVADEPEVSAEVAETEVQEEAAE